MCMCVRAVHIRVNTGVVYVIVAQRLRPLAPNPKVMGSRLMKDKGFFSIYTLFTLARIC